VDLKTLLALRPKEPTSTEIQKKLGEVGDAIAETELRIATLRAERPSVLHSGTPDQVQASRAALRSAEDDLAELVDLRAGHAEALGKAQKAEATARLQTLKADAERATAAAVAAWQRDYLPAAIAIAGIVALEDAAVAKVAAYNGARGTVDASDSFPLLLTPIQQVTPPSVSVANRRSRLGEDISLPSALKPGDTGSAIYRRQREA
jgi:hypothetical protein